MPALRQVYPGFAKAALTGGVNVANPIRAILVNGYIFDPTHGFASQVVDKEAVANGPTINPPNYSPGGVVLGNVTMGEREGSVVLLADDVIFPEITAYVDGILFYVDTGNSASSVLIAHEHFFGRQIDDARVFFHFPNREFLRLRLEALPWP